jgi:hypothetical protein
MIVTGFEGNGRAKADVAKARMTAANHLIE